MLTHFGVVIIVDVFVKKHSVKANNAAAGAQNSFVSVFCRKFNQTFCFSYKNGGSSCTSLNDHTASCGACISW